MARTVHPPAQTSTDAYGAVAGSDLQTHAVGETFIAYRIEETGGANGITAKVQGRLPGGAWHDLTGRDEAGAAHASAEVAIGAGAQDVIIVTPQHDSGALAAFAEYRVAVKSTVGGSAGEATVEGVAK